MVQGNLGSRKENVEKIRELAYLEKNSEDIGSKTGLSSSTVIDYAYDNQIKLSGIRLYDTKENRLKSIKQLIKSGVEYADDIAKELGISINTIVKYARESELKLPKLKNNRYSYEHPKKDEKKDELIRDGLTLEAIGQRTDVTRERIRQYILGTGQHDLWREARKERKNVLGNLVSQIRNIGNNLASQIEKIVENNYCKEDNWAYEKTKEYFYSKRYKINNEKYSFDRIFSLFKDYHQALENGDKVSLKKFGERHGFHFVSVGKFFGDVGLKPLGQLFTHERKKRVATPKYKKQALEKVVEVEMPNPDIAYFLNLPNYVISQFFSIYYKGYKKRPKVKRFIRGGPRYKKSILNYRKASEIYEAEDASFSEKEILELCNISKEVYDYALDNKKEISKHIMKNLEIMFPDRKIKKPYRNFSVE